ncbi:MAG: Bax inhibitor-1/YccA family protein [Gammaproteobacteria bacterium]|nr:Bax inhibitor-1/YccA family protein [Gammaproteobacteria bacterium]
MFNNQTVVTRPRESVLETNKVLRNTYSLLSMTLLFSGLTAAVSTSLNMGPWTYLISIIAAMVMAIFVLPRTANSSTGVLVVFAITGLFGFALGPILSMYLHMAHGGRIIATAFGGTGVIFLALSAYVLTTRKDFSFVGGFLMVGLLTLFVLSLVNLFIGMPILSLAISGAVILIFSGFILFDTSRIIHGGETNYLFATVALYMDIFNIFISLLQILGIMGSDD